jgi:hypothetical protein
MNDTDKARQRGLDLDWLDVRIAQRLAQERAYWRCHVVDLIAAEHERLATLVEEERRKLIDWVKADHKEVFDLVKWNHEQSRKMIAKVIEASIGSLIGWRPSWISTPPLVLHGHLIDTCLKICPGNHLGFGHPTVRRTTALTS